MDREQQLAKLINVLRRTARSARDGNEEVVERARMQFNRVLEALTGLDETLKAVFSPLDEGVSGALVSAACQDVAAYFQDEVEYPDVPFDADSFREFWKKSAKDIEDVGEFIRQSLGQLHREKKKENHSNGESSS